MADIAQHENFAGGSANNAMDLLNKAWAIAEEVSSNEILYKIHNSFYHAYKQLNQHA